ncbi:MAG TPA: FtsH protease activity modulator HflK [Thermohalobaculum sp.]|nr:FtsH protease activity modulator HflK [Thermohalobaculum sp.]
MPYSSNDNGGRGKGPWGGGGGRGKGPWGGGGGGDGGQQGPDLDDLLRKGREQLRVVLGGRGGKGGGGSGGGGGGRGFERLLPIAIPAVLVAFWLMQSFYRVDTGEESVELFLGEFSQIGTEGLNFAPWPLITYEILPVRRETTIDIGRSQSTGQRRTEQGLILTGDENIVDVEYQVVWNISRPDLFLFNLAEPDRTIQAVSESAMREVIARNQLKPILSRDRAVIAEEVQALIQEILDSYESGVNIVRFNFDDADPPAEVIDAFRDVQAAEQDRETAQNRADAYAREKVAGARGEVAQIMQEAEGYRAQQVNQAKGEAARFESILIEYTNAPDVTRKRLHLETIERVLGDVDKVIIDEAMNGQGGGQGVVPYLPLTELRRSRDETQTPGENQ